MGQGAQPVGLVSCFRRSRSPEFHSLYAFHGILDAGCLLALFLLVVGMGFALVFKEDCCSVSELSNSVGLPVPCRVVSNVSSQ